MTTSPGIRKRLETELRRVQERLRIMGIGPIPPDLAAAAGEGASLGDLHEQAQASEVRELAYEARSRLMKRLGELRRLLTVPEATLCVPCQERQERTTAGRRGSL